LAVVTGLVHGLQSADGAEMNRRRTEARKQRYAGKSSPPPAEAAGDDPVETLIARSRRVRAKGDVRRALVLLRQACALDEWRARTWTLLGALLAREGAREEAGRALNQARWLRARAGETGRAVVTERLASSLLPDAA
jgi:Flp pilus assembly protein TadD